jgi:type II secretory pathway pseudopilin PulG
MPRTNSPATASRARFATRYGPLRSNAGFTLIEVLVTALIVILIASATARALISTSHASGDQRLRSQADAIASQDQDRLRGLSDAQLNGLNQTRPETVSGAPFTVLSKATYLDTTGATTCTTNSVAYYKISTKVGWGPEAFNSNAPAANTSLSVESILSRPVSGGLLVQVKDQKGAWLPGVSIRAVGPDTQASTTQASTTDTNGCVLFAGLTAGGYVATMTDSGYVDQNGNSAPTATATVTGTGVQAPSSLPIYMGQAGSIIGSFTTSTTGALGEADGISWSGSGTSPTAMSNGFQTAPSSAPAAPLTTLTTGSLFPFYRSVGTVGYANNYVVWGGRCAGQQPPSSYTSATVNPGQAGQAVPVQEPLLFVGPVNVGGTPVRPAHVKLTFTSTGSSTSCTDTWSPTLAAGTTMPTATGWLANPGQPYAGTNALTVCVDYKSSTNAYYKAQVATSNANLTTGGTTNVPITLASVTAGTTC